MSSLSYIWIYNKMRLEKVILDGFKSFADKTQLDFNMPITAVVGPNGCGKSNIVDAIKWVLGEQSVKSLRSGQMADVIFSGSSSRKPSGMAEVNLIISNKEGKLPIESQEVQITRRIYKSGDSEYLINNKVSRLKDVKELFMGTGVGVKAYSIIEQGQVDQLLTASKTDRRAIFEEAAGISRYKAHKKEALRKLERTEQNLLRLADILGEVQKQLRSIKLQAGKARNYLEYTQRLKELQVNFSLVEYHKLYKSGIDKKTEISDLEQRFAALAAETSKIDADISNSRHQISETENQVSAADNRLVTVQSKIEQQLQRIEFLKTRTAELQERKTAVENRLEKLCAQQKTFNSDLTQYRIELENCEKQLSEKQQAVRDIEKVVAEIDTACRSLVADLDDEKSGIIDIVRMTAQLHNEVQSISVYRNNLSNQKDRLSGKVKTAEVELERLLTEKAQHSARMDDIEKVLSQLQQNLDSKRKQSEELGDQIAQSGKHLAHSKESRSAINRELVLLSDMEERREGLSNATKTLLENRSSQDDRFRYIEGVLADIILADVDYVHAVEAALEGITDAVVINNSASLLDDSDTIAKLDGRVNFLCMDKLAPFVDKTDLTAFAGVKGRLIEFVHYDSNYAPLAWKLLGKTIIADSLESASMLTQSLGGDYRFVTLKGEILDSTGQVGLGPLSKNTGLISRKSRLVQLRDIMTNLTAEIESVEEELDKKAGIKEHAEKLCKELRTAVYEATTEKMQVHSKLALIEQNITRLRQEQPLLAGEIDLLEEQISQSVQKEYQSKQKLEELDAVNKERAERIKILEQDYAEKQREHQKQVTLLTDSKVSLGQIAEHNKSLKQTIIALEQQLHTANTAMQGAKAEAKSCVEQSQETLRNILSCESAVSELFFEKENVQKASQILHEKVRKLIEELESAEQLLKEKRTEQTDVEQKINEYRIELGQIDVRQQSLVERVREELQLDLVASYEKYQEQQMDWEAVKEEIAELRGKIERLGNVNVDAIAQQDDLEKRNEFLSTQVEDLNSSKGQLQQLINRLNNQSIDKFRETFEQIRINFQGLFRKLFGGGKADILLDNPDDILEAGIEIIARPPGKEPRSISLLSGGEKTMTAIALLFAVFQSRPSPFCILDEVDAALDEANNERFNLIIREFQKESQFIVITHSKRTMSIADILYGVTMQTRGVSKKISVKFDDYDPQEQKEEIAAA